MLSNIRDGFLKQWDRHRKLLSDGDKSSYSRDWFESVLDYYETEIFESSTNLSKLRIRWQPMSEIGAPPKDSNELYGDRYSVPVLIANEITGQVSYVAHVYDYRMMGWVPVTMHDGPDPGDYETQHVTHWALWPQCKLVCDE